MTVQELELGACAAAVVISLIAAGISLEARHRLGVFTGRALRSKLARKHRV